MSKGGEQKVSRAQKGRATVTVNGVKFPTGIDKKAPSRKAAPWKELVMSMVPNQWVDFPDQRRKTALYTAAYSMGVMIRTRKLKGGGFRCWRIEK